MAATKERLTPAQVVEALHATEGLVYMAAERLKVSAQTVYNYAHRHACVQEALSHHKGKRLDTAESKLWKAVLDGEAWAICFYLKTQGKSRGYVERSEVTGADGATLTIKTVIVTHADRGSNGAAAHGPGPVLPQ